MGRLSYTGRSRGTFPLRKFSSSRNFRAISIEALARDRALSASGAAGLPSTPQARSRLPSSLCRLEKRTQRHQRGHRQRDHQPLPAPHCALRRERIPMGHAATRWLPIAHLIEPTPQLPMPGKLRDMPSIGRQPIGKRILFGAGQTPIVAQHPPGSFQSGPTSFISARGAPSHVRLLPGPCIPRKTLPACEVRLSPAPPPCVR